MGNGDVDAGRLLEISIGHGATGILSFRIE